MQKCYSVDRALILLGGCVTVVKPRKRARIQVGIQKQDLSYLVGFQRKELQIILLFEKEPQGSMTEPLRKIAQDIAFALVKQEKCRLIRLMEINKKAGDGTMLKFKGDAPENKNRMSVE